MGRHPPHVYLRDPHAGEDDPPASTSAEPPFPTTSTLSPGQPVNIPPAVRHYLPTLQPAPPVLQHSSTQTTPPHSTTHASQQTDLVIITPPMINEDQQTTPPTSAASRSKQPTSHNTPHLSRLIYMQLSGTRALPHPTQPLPPLLLLPPHLTPLHLSPRPALHQQSTSNPTQSAPLTIGCTPISFQQPQSISHPRPRNPPILSHPWAAHHSAHARKLRRGRARLASPEPFLTGTSNRSTPRIPRAAAALHHHSTARATIPTTTTTFCPAQATATTFTRFHGSHSLLVACHTFAIPGPIPFHTPAISSSPDHTPWPAPYTAQQYHHSLTPPQPQPASTFLGDPAQPLPHSQYTLPPAQPSRPQRVQPGQQEYRTEDDPWCNYSRGWEHQ